MDARRLYGGSSYGQVMHSNLAERHLTCARQRDRPPCLLALSHCPDPGVQGDMTFHMFATQNLCSPQRHITRLRVSRIRGALCQRAASGPRNPNITMPATDTTAVHRQAEAIISTWRPTSVHQRHRMHLTDW